MITILDQSFRIEKDIFEDALEALKEVDMSRISSFAFVGWNDIDDAMSNTYDRLTRWGIQWSPGDERFSLKDALYNAETVEQFLGFIDIDVTYDLEGSIDGLKFELAKHWQNFMGTCLEALTPFIVYGSYIVFQAGNDDDPTFYRYTFGGDVPLIEEGHRQIVWEDIN